jgi:hypothetical protein
LMPHAKRAISSNSSRGLRGKSLPASP